ncbi:Phage integrase family protein [Streptomyces zhaozhouensis]|uniref:Phage integrase family protein n=1 Tax=Streptomyces zhaozhouensis TaxID=1300267 RepID=A0A286E928_9ACTN|nr:DUF4158 domain-containing protein [Streptomyces zhaozhouensis]SOD67393.1 Phage integrase family protein [Streptomyces zhaozhouensis]
MPVEYLSAEQEARYCRFATEPSPGELEQFFRLDAKALELARVKRRPATKLGWAVQWGTVRMLGTFVTEEPAAVPASVVRFVAEQLDVEEERFAEYGTRPQTVYEHTWEIRDVYGYRDFAAGEEELRAFLAARVWSSLEGPRALFDRAVVWLVNNRVLLPGVTTLARMVATVRQEENDRLHAALYEAVPSGLRTEMVRLLEVPEKKRVSELERLRLGPMRVSGKAMEAALERTREVRELGAGAVDVEPVPAARMTGLARYGLTSKAPTLKRLEVTRQTATLLATVRHLETATVDDALDLLHALMATRLLAKAERLGNDAKLKALPQLRRAAKKVAAAVDVLMTTPPATESGEMVSVVDAWSAIERVVPREQLAAALATIAAVVPEEGGDDEAEWRAELVARYGTVRGFIRLLVEVIDFQRRCGPEDRAIPRNYIYTCLNEALAASGLTGPGNEQLRYTPHDFRRIFVTDALRSGLPPHIAARICGHRTVDTTLGYAAIYPEDVINHHRSFIARRRALRPGEEYREPTAQEWQDFLAHFELRKVALGVCARDFGTPCVHEHACIRCPVLRPDPEQMPRLEEIHANLLDRLQEAKEQGWLGEVAAIEASLAAAEQKLAAMRDLAARDTTVHLGMPDLRGVVARIDSEQRNEDAKQQP